MPGYTLDDVGLAAMMKAPEVDDVVHSVAYAIFDESQRLVHVVTGALKESGFVDPPKGERSGDGTYRVGYGDPEGPVNYAAYVEYGTRHMNAEPYLIPAAERWRGQIR